MKKPIILIFIFLLQCLYIKTQTREDTLNLNLSASQLGAFTEERKLVLIDVLRNKRLTIEEGVHAAIQLRGDTSSMDVILSHFFSDTVLLSVFEPELKGEQIEMTFGEFKLMPLDSIEWIAVYPKHPKLIYWTGFVFVIVGVEFVVLPLIMPLITGDLELYSAGVTYGLVAGGIGSFVLGRSIMRALNPKFYYLKNPWNYRTE